jgi:4-methylaminobutanoate oxidase (formaldehyde-forming)
MGPRSRELLQRLTDDDVSKEAFPFFTARSLTVGAAPTLAVRASFVGELGFELNVPSSFAVHVFDRLMDAGGDLGLRLAGSHALDSLRIEKGFVHVGHDVGPTDDPIAAGLGHVVRPGGGFVGANRVGGRGQGRRLVQVVLDDPEPLLFHGESVLADGRVVGLVTSGAYAHTLGAAAGIAWLDTSVADEGATVEVDCAGTRVKATVATRPPYDPDGSRLRA